MIPFSQDKFFYFWKCKIPITMNDSEVSFFNPHE